MDFKRSEPRIESASSPSAGTSVGAGRRRRTDGVIAELAAAQHGIVTRRQLERAGVSAGSIDSRVRAGLLISVHGGVYRVGPVISPRAREMAAVLACPGATASHLTAAALWQCLDPQREADPVHLTVGPTVRTGRRPGICAHRGELTAHEVTPLDGIPVTTPARTMIDLCMVAGPRIIERAFACAVRLKLFRLDDLRALLERHAGRAGTRLLRDLLQRDTLPPYTRSKAEDLLLELIRRAGLPEPEMNVMLHGVEVDCYWRSARLAIEVDGFEYHTSARAFVRDRQRDAALAAAGIQVLRLSWHQITRESEKTIVQIALALARLHA